MFSVVAAVVVVVVAMKPAVVLLLCSICVTGKSWGVFLEINKEVFVAVFAAKVVERNCGSRGRKAQQLVGEFLRCSVKFFV